MLLFQQSAEKEVGKPVVEKDKMAADKEPEKKDKTEVPSPKKAPAPAPPASTPAATGAPEPASEPVPAPPAQVTPSQREGTPQPEVTAAVAPQPAAVSDEKQKLQVKVEEKEEDRLSDEGLGASSDEISDFSQVRLKGAAFRLLVFICGECIVYVLLLDFI